MTKLTNSNSDQTQKINFWQNVISDKTSNSLLVKTTWLLNNQWDVLGSAFCNLAMFIIYRYIYIFIFLLYFINILFFLKNKWHLTHYTWHRTPDTKQVKCDMWHTVAGDNFPKFQFPSFEGLGMKVLGRFLGKWWLTELMNEEDTCRTAPSTPGLLITFIAQYTLQHATQAVKWTL